MLISISKKKGLTLRSTYLRWYIKTHKMFSRRLFRNFLIKARIDPQIALWRFKDIVRPFKHRKRLLAIKFIERFLTIWASMAKYRETDSVKTAFVQMKIKMEVRRNNEKYLAFSS